MRKALAMQVCPDRKSTEGRMKIAEERRGEMPLHLAYFLCYPYMVKRSPEEDRPGPWDQRF